MSTYAPETFGRGGDWRDTAGCIDRADDMFPDDSDSHALQRARGICGACPVVRDCLIAALREERGDDQYRRAGIRGGLTPAERYAEYRRHNRSQGRAA